jgi:hypothetical protein
MPRFFLPRHARTHLPGGSDPLAIADFIGLSWAYGAYRNVTVPSNTVSASLDFEYFATNDPDEFSHNTATGRIECTASGTFLVISAHRILGLAADAIPLTEQVTGEWSTSGPGLNEHSNLEFGTPVVTGYVPDGSITGDGVWVPHVMGLTSVRGGGLVAYENNVHQETGSDMKAYGQLVIVQISTNYDAGDFDVTPTP